MKVKRKVVTDRHLAVIDGMYAVPTAKSA